MLYSTNLHAILGKNSAASGFSHVVRNRINDRLSLHVGALDFISVVVRSRIESNGQVKSRVKTFTTEGKTVFQSLLFQHLLLIYLLF